MNNKLLKSTAQSLVAKGKGILAADESSKTIKKRFEKLGLVSNPETNLAYRKMLFTTPGIEKYLSGVILFDETLRQEIDGVSVPKYLESKGIISGIKTDKGVIEMVNFPGEKITEGLDGLAKRYEEYAQMGAKFAKFRTVIKIGDGIPTQTCFDANAEVIARYSAITQNAGLVPIIEPELLRDGDYDLETCKEITIKNLKAVFERHTAHRVAWEGLILKTNMVTCGEDNPNQAAPEEVAKATIEAYLESVPKELPAIVFLSGGQSPDMATDNLKALCKSKSPWPFSFSFSRALQGEAMEIWAGKNENIDRAQKVFLERVKKVSEARSQQPSLN